MKFYLHNLTPLTFFNKKKNIEILCNTVVNDLMIESDDFDGNPSCRGAPAMSHLTFSVGEMNGTLLPESGLPKIAATTLQLYSNSEADQDKQTLSSMVTLQ